jgi:hypothetical protein
MRYENEVRDILSDGEEWRVRDICEAVTQVIPTAPYAQRYLLFCAGMDFNANNHLWLICRRDAGRWYSDIRGVLLKGQRQGWARNVRRGWWKSS